MTLYNIPLEGKHIKKNTMSLLTAESKLFLGDVLTGLRAEEKYLDSKYLYDANGGKLFQQIMHCEEYYPYKCELEIFSRYSAELAGAVIDGGDEFEVVELGSGDSSKTIHLLSQLLKMRAEFIYNPIDISEQVISDLNVRLPEMLPDLQFEGLQGDYFTQLENIYAKSSKRKVILFLGSNLGNMPVYDAMDFCRRLRGIMSAGDMLIAGIDIKKNPLTVLSAYNDKAGITRDFNLNLLRRINRELGGNFDIRAFDHFPTYDPQTGTCKSYLVSQKRQVLKLQGSRITFKEGECIHMEISQKYTLAEIEQIAEVSSFENLKSFFDRQKWFTDVIWRAV